MFGIDVRYHCPKCNRDRETDLGCTPYIKYKGRNLAVIHCYYCGEKLACETARVDDTKGMYTYSDKTGLGILSKLEKFFEDKGYNEKTPEDIIEAEMWDFAVENFGSVAMSNEYEIKSYIQKLLSKFNQSSLFSITFKELDKESEKEGKCVYSDAGGICW